jgi:hypothetical protein
VLLAVVLPLRHDLGQSPLHQAVATIVRDRQPGDAVLIDSQIDFQSYWELRRSGQHIPLEVHRASPVFERFAVALEGSPRVWVLCPSECNARIHGRLTGYAETSRYGRYLRLMERRP